MNNQTKGAAQKAVAPTTKQTGMSSPDSHIKKPSFMTRVNVRLTAKEKVLFARYLSVLQESGLPLQDSLKILQEQAKGSMLKILGTLISEIDNGHMLADGLQHYPHVFSAVFINLVRAGEQSGTLQENLDYLSDYMQREYEFKKNLQGAMMYPGLIFFGGMGVTILIILYVLPNIASLFESMDVTLPWTTITLLWIADIFQTKTILAFSVLLGAPIVFFLFTHLPFIRPLSERILFRVPVVGTLMRYSILSRLFRLLGILLKSDMPIEGALAMTGTVVNSYLYRDLLVHVKSGVVSGQDLSVLFSKDSSLVPPIAQHLILVGNQTATLSKNFLYLASFYEDEVSETTKRIGTLIEPVLILMMGLMVAFIAFSVLAPIYQVVNLV